MNNEGAACGGVISESYLQKHGPEGVMMSYVLPDEQYIKYRVLKETGNKKEADKIFGEYAWSLI